MGAADGWPATGGFALTARWRSGMVMAGLGREHHAKANDAALKEWAVVTKALGEGRRAAGAGLSEAAFTERAEAIGAFPVS